MAAPRLFVSGPTSIEAQWSAPSSVNGILERYVLFLSDTSGADGEPVYNSTDLFLDFVIRDLTPGTQYYVAVMVRLIVCGVFVLLQGSLRGTVIVVTS